MDGIIFLFAIHLFVLGVWFLPGPVWVWLEDNATNWGDLPAGIRAIPMALVAGWLSFGIVGPVLDRVLGTHGPEPLDLLLRASPFLLCAVTLFFSWPPILIPPGARTQDVRADAAWFEGHPFLGLGLVALFIILAIAIGWVSHH